LKNERSLGEEGGGFGIWNLEFGLALLFAFVLWFEFGLGLGLGLGCVIIVYYYCVGS
jgi:hypothetical protein